MSLAAIPEVELRRELGRSFISLLQSYFRVHQLGSIPHQDEGPDGQPVIKTWKAISPTTKRVWIIWVAYSSKTGKGNWRIFNLDDTQGTMRENKGMFEFDPDGTVSQDGVNLQMDHAAIDIVAYFMNIVNSDGAEVLA